LRLPVLLYRGGIFSLTTTSVSCISTNESDPPKKVTPLSIWMPCCCVLHLHPCHVPSPYTVQQSVIIPHVGNRSIQCEEQSPSDELHDGISHSFLLLLLIGHISCCDCWCDAVPLSAFLKRYTSIREQESLLYIEFSWTISVGCAVLLLLLGRFAACRCCVEMSCVLHFSFCFCVAVRAVRVSEA